MRDDIPDMSMWPAKVYRTYATHGDPEAPCGVCFSRRMLSHFSRMKDFGKSAYVTTQSKEEGTRAFESVSERRFSPDDQPFGGGADFFADVSRRRR